ncbi:MAG TPA: zinc ribbon domain-containing protein, partial [Acidimicrobiales bacterium]|nr:zinc ribbon domain-containing protein [Acidimicrobiales bacterium]
PPSREYPLHRVLRCSECGHWLSAMPRSLGGGKSSRNYGCRKGLGDGRCGHVFVTAGAVEARVAEVLLPVADSSGLRDLIDEQEGDVRERAAELVVANAQDEKKLTELDDMFGDGTLPKDAYLRQANRLRERVRQRAAELQTLRGTSALSRLGGDVTGSWESMSADDKRLVAQALLMAVDVTPASRRGSNLFDPKRLRFVWRWDALLKIADDVE